MSYIQLALIALVQGITEWLPISSSAHVLLAADFFGAKGRDELLINAVSNLGTLAAMLIYFRKDVASAVIGGFELVAAPVTKAPLSSGARLALCIVVATPFALGMVLVSEKLLPEGVQEVLRGNYVVAGATIFFGALLWWADSSADVAPSSHIAVLICSGSNYFRVSCEFSYTENFVIIVRF